MVQDGEQMLVLLRGVQHGQDEAVGQGDHGVGDGRRVFRNGGRPT
jgi:hypothetical protein